MYEEIRSKVFGLTGCKFGGEITVKDFDGVSVSYDGKKAVLGGRTVPQIARAHFLLAKAISEGKNTVSVEEHPCFESCGVMLDMSRNGVMRVEAVKKYIDYMVTLGMNLLMLYTEDTYEIEGYPHFGYLRGKYSVAEMKEIDDYAFANGVEVVPCIQTLAHLEQYLQWWAEANEIKDTENILLIDEPKTYDFIEACIKSLRNCFRSKRIHIGMDEAHGIGMGQYFKLHGAVDKYDLLTRHLNKVVSICNNYDFKPMMWSDMLFRLGSKNNDYDLNSSLSDSVINAIPDVGMVYWNYYDEDENVYDKFLKKHEDFGLDVIFAGGIWVWSGMLPNSRKTEKSMVPALKKCCEHKTKTVLATMWGDDGCETNHFFTTGLLPFFSEYCYKGADTTLDEIYETGAFLSGMTREYYEAMSTFHSGDTTSTNQWACRGKVLLYSDLFYQLGIGMFDTAYVEENYKNALEICKKYDNVSYNEYVKTVYDVAIRKADLFVKLIPAYKAGDKAALLKMAKEDLPELKKAMEKLLKLHKAQWLETYKPNGLEVIVGRYGAIIAKIDYYAETLEAYVNGDISTVAELDEEHFAMNPPTYWARGMYSPSAISQ